MDKSLQILTPRLILRVPHAEDGQEIHAAMNEVWNDLQMWMSWAYDGHNTIEAVHNFINSADTQLKEGGLPLVGFHRESGRFVVSTGVSTKRGVFETGYWVAKDFLGKGYATEATNAVLRYGFDEMASKEAYIYHYGGNRASARVIEKLGFTKTGVEKKIKDRCLDGFMMDEHRYVMRDSSVLPKLNVSWN